MEITKEKLTELYIDKKMTYKEISKETSYSQSYICNLMKKYNIKTRYKDFKTLGVTKEKLYNMYSKENMTSDEIGDSFGVSGTSVLRWLKRHNIKTRSNPLKKDNKQFLKEVKDLVGKEYTFLEEYINAITEIKIRHNRCGHIYKIQPAIFLYGIRCPRCYGKKIGDALRKTTDQFKREVENLVGKEYKVLEEYKRADIKIAMKHNICGKIYTVKPSNFLSGCRCSWCSSSSPEQIIMNYLERNKCQYRKEHKFEDCKYKNKLRFDFAIFKDKELKALVEYDSKIHYESIDHYGGDKAFNLRLKLDKIKNKYCHENNIPLIRIPYWEKNNIEVILENGLKDVNRYSIYNIHK